MAHCGAQLTAGCVFISDLCRPAVRMRLGSKTELKVEVRSRFSFESLSNQMSGEVSRRALNHSITITQVIVFIDKIIWIFIALAPKDVNRKRHRINQIVLRRKGSKVFNPAICEGQLTITKQFHRKLCHIWSDSFCFTLSTDVAMNFNRILKGAKSKNSKL